MKKFTLFFFSLLFTVAYGQTMYRCGNTFSEQPCGPDARKLATGTSQITAAQELTNFRKKMADKLPDSPPPPAVIAANKTICEQQARAKLKDPEGARIKDVTRVGAANQYNNGPIFPGVTYTLIVNGRNSYGGYTGEKLHACAFTPDERTFSHTYEVGKWPN